MGLHHSPTRERIYRSIADLGIAQSCFIIHRGTHPVELTRNPGRYNGCRVEPSAQCETAGAGSADPTPEPPHVGVRAGTGTHRSGTDRAAALRGTSQHQRFVGGTPLPAVDARRTDAAMAQRSGHLHVARRRLPRPGIQRWTASASTVDIERDPGPADRGDPRRRHHCGPGAAGDRCGTRRAVAERARHLAAVPDLHPPIRARASNVSPLARTPRPAIHLR